MAPVTVERLYEEAKQLPTPERMRLGRLLLTDSAGQSGPESFFDTDPLLREVRAAVRGAADQPFASLEEAMSWSRGYDWRAEP